MKRGIIKYEDRILGFCTKNDGSQENCEASNGPRKNCNKKCFRTHNILFAEYLIHIIFLRYQEQKVQIESIEKNSFNNEDMFFAVDLQYGMNIVFPCIDNAVRYIKEHCQPRNSYNECLNLLKHIYKGRIYYCHSDTKLLTIIIGLNHAKMISEAYDESYFPNVRPI
jgi:hypothetical protein